MAARPHTKLGKEVLIISAYAHDWLFRYIKNDEVMDADKIENAKKLHIELGVEKIKELLKDEIFSF